MNYVIKILVFLTPPLPLWLLSVLNVIKNCHFLTPPPSPLCDYVIHGCSPIQLTKIFTNYKKRGRIKQIKGLNYTILYLLFWFDHPLARVEICKKLVVFFFLSIWRQENFFLRFPDLYNMTLKAKKGGKSRMYIFFGKKKAHPRWNLFAYRLPTVICSQLVPKKVLRQLNEFRKSTFL